MSYFDVQNQVYICDICLAVLGSIGCCKFEENEKQRKLAKTAQAFRKILK